MPLMPSLSAGAKRTSGSVRHVASSFSSTEVCFEGVSAAQQNMVLNIFKSRGGMPPCSSLSRQRPCSSENLNDAPICHEVGFKVSPERVYEALTDAKQCSAFSGLPAEIHGEARGSFKCFDGQITGRMTELVPSQKIVQAWHVAMWPDDVNSMV